MFPGKSLVILTCLFNKLHSGEGDLERRMAAHGNCNTHLNIIHIHTLRDTHRSHFDSLLQLALHTSGGSVSKYIQMRNLLCEPFYTSIAWLDF